MHRFPSRLAFSTQALQLWLAFLRQEVKYTRLNVSRLQRRNEQSTAPVTSPEGPVVSVTTYGARLNSVHLALESIAAGSRLPSRLILWVDEVHAIENPSAGLQRLMKRGLELRLSENFGPHTKYYPYLLAEEEFERPLITADDDLLYSRWWLEGLMLSFAEYPDAVSCYRAHVVAVEDHHVAPYRSWPACLSTKPSYAHFGTGVSGCLYPPRLLLALKQAGSAFMQLCPKADDVWLHANALRAGLKTRQVLDRGLRFPFVPGTQDSGLYHTNVLQARNDEQIARTYTAVDLALLESNLTE